MNELVTLWRSTRMIVLVALCAALYAAILIPFKIATIIPGLTEIRPANAIPIVCSLLFGPAAAWGSAFGNLIGDAFGATFGPGSIFGFIANFLYGYIPYRAWRSLTLRRASPDLDFSARGWLARVLFLSLLASLACAFIVAYGVSVLRLFPFGPMAAIVTLNNFVVSAILAPPLLAAVYPRVRRWGLLYHQVLRADELSSSRLSLAAHALLWIAVIGGMAAGFVISFGLHGIPIVGKAAELVPLAAKESGIGLALLPAVALVLVACALL